LTTSELHDEGYHSHETEVELKELVGARGVAHTMLRPAGMALFGDLKVDVVSEGGFVERNHPVEVVRIEGRRILVRPL
jgi:membrane-bound serine protease (ClpP class)